MCERRAAVVAEGFMPGQATAANEDSGALIWSSSGPIWGGINRLDTWQLRPAQDARDESVANLFYDRRCRCAVGGGLLSELFE
jgi:hypothetical protein